MRTAPVADYGDKFSRWLKGRNPILEALAGPKHDPFTVPGLITARPDGEKSRTEGLRISHPLLVAQNVRLSIRPLLYPQRLDLRRPRKLSAPIRRLRKIHCASAVIQDLNRQQVAILDAFDVSYFHFDQWQRRPSLRLRALRTERRRNSYKQICPTNHSPDFEWSHTSEDTAHKAFVPAQPWKPIVRGRLSHRQHLSAITPQRLIRLTLCAIVRGWPQLQKAL
jgi:hypothetical protein